MVILTVAVFFYVLFKSRIKQKDIKNKVFSSFAGLFLGLMSSFLGIGGGPINIMVLSYVPSFSYPLLLMMMVFAVIGASAGRSISKRLDSHKIDVMFLWMLVLITFQSP